MKEEPNKQLPSLPLLAEPQIVKSPFDKNKLAIAYPYTKNGEWIHKEDILKHFTDKQRIREAIGKTNGPNFSGKLINGTINTERLRILQELGLK